MKEKFDVTGMTCSACSSRVEKCVSKLEGVEEVTVNLLTNSMQVKYDENVLEEQGIIDAVVHAGYGASPARESSGFAGGSKGTAVGQAQRQQGENGKNPVQEHLEYMKKRTFWSFVFLIPPDVCVHGTYDRRATSRIFAWNGKCSGFCYDSVFAVSSSVVY